MTEAACPVKLLQTTKSATLESQLADQLRALSNDAAVGEFLKRTKKSFGSIRAGEDVHFFRRLREQYFTELLMAPEIPRWSTLRDKMEDEENSCITSDFSIETLPLLLHQFFVDRIDTLVRRRLMYMQRWARFHKSNPRTQAIHDDYRRHLSLIMAEYDDCVQRAARLAAARDAYLHGKAVKVGIVKDEDVHIFLRDLVLKQQSWKKVTSFLTMLKWLPHRHFHQLSAPMDIVAWEEEGDTREPLAKLRAMTPKASVQWKIAFERRKSSANPSGIREEASAPSQGKLGGFLGRLGGKKSAPPVSEPSAPKEDVSSFAYCSASTLPTNSRGAGAVPILSVSERDYKSILEKLLVTYCMPAAWDLEAPSEHLKLFYEVSQKFKASMERQQKQMTFQVYQFPKYLEESKPEAAQEKRTSSNRAWLKEVNWLDEAKFVPTVDPLQEDINNTLVQATKIDQLLELCAQSCHLHDIDKVLYSLRRYVASVYNPPRLQCMTHRGGRSGINTIALARIWKQILQGIDPFDPSFSMPGDENKDKKRGQNLPEDEKQAASPADIDPFAKSEDSGFDFRQANTVLKDEKQDLFDGQKQKANQLKDGYMAYTLLRHIRIRDLRRTALSLLNYFRSVERTLVIGLTGLAKSKQAGKVPSSRAYIFEKPSDFQISNTDFMEFQEIENHDDFYAFENGRIHVLDHWMYHIIYDAAIEDLKKLEHYLVQLGSHYITKCSIAKGTTDRVSHSYLPEEKELPAFSGQMIDRYGVLFDLWNCHIGFMERKRALLDCYLEAYQNVFEKEEKKRLAQVIFDIIHQKPRHVLRSTWFVRCYQLENECLELHRQLIQSLLSSQIITQRQLIKAMHQSGGAEDVFGVPLPNIPKFPLLLSSTTNQLEQIYMLEFHPSLCMASRIPAALQHVLQVASFQVSAHSPHNTLRCHRQVLQIAIKQLGECSQLTQSFLPNIKHTIFHNQLLENPQFVVSLAIKHSEDALKSQGDSGDASEAKCAQMQAWCDVVRFITMFQRLGNACLECAMLTKSYTELAAPLGFGAMHAFLRMASMDVAASNPSNIPSKPFSMSDLNTEGRELFDQYSPAFSPLAVEEVDDKVFNLQLESKEDIFKMLSPNSLETLCTILHAQVCQKNALTAGLLHVRTCNQIHKTSSSLEHVASVVQSTESSASSIAAAPPGKNLKRVSSAQLVVGLDLVKQLSAVFLSLQLHKAAARDAMMREIFSQPGIANKLNSPSENLKVKRSAVALYCKKLNELLAPQCLRTQLVSCVHSLQHLLKSFPSTRDALFECGKEEDDKQGTSLRSHSGRASQVLSGHGMANFDPSYRPGHARPRVFMSDNGKLLLNLFFLPHPLSIMSMFKTLDLADATKALTTALNLLSGLHDIMSVACARARLGCPIEPLLQSDSKPTSSSASLLSSHTSKLSGDWGGLEGVTNELLDIQLGISQLKDPTNPEQVVEYLAGLRTVQYTQMVAVVRDTLPVTLLEAGDELGCETVRTKSWHCIERISDANSCSLAHWKLSKLPEPLHIMHAKAKALLPWHYFMTSSGPFTLSLAPPTNLGGYVHAAFSSLDQKQRRMAQGALAELSLLMDEVCQDAAAFDEIQEPPSNTKASSKSKPAGLKYTSARSVSSMKASSVSLSRSATEKSATAASSRTFSLSTRQLGRLESNRVKNQFLLLSLKFGTLKATWQVHSSGEVALKQSKAFLVSRRLYQMNIFNTAWSSICRERQLAQCASQDGGDGGDPPSAVLGSGVSPRNVGETELRQAQVEVLVNSLECRMIEELQANAASQLYQLQTEMIRDDGALPTDVWKKLYTKASLCVPRSAVVENLSDALLEHCREDGDNLVIPKEAYEHCFGAAGQQSVIRDHVLYDCYSSYYEGTIQKAQHELLVKEREIAHLQEQIKQAESLLEHEIQDKLVTHCYPIVMEAIALRACLEHAEEAMEQQADEIRAEVHRHYTHLVKGMFKTSFAAKRKMEDFRESLYSDVVKCVGDVKTAALSNMKRVRQRALAPLDSNDEGAEKHDALALAMDEVPRTVDIQLENAALNNMFFRLRTVSKWQRETAKQYYLKEFVDLQQAMNRIRGESLTAEEASVEASHVAEQQRDLLVKRVAELRLKVAECEKQVNDEKRNLDQVQSQRDRVIVHRHRIKKPTQEDIDNLKQSLEEKEAILHSMTREFGAERLQSSHSEARARKSIRHLQAQLQQERQLKHSAFEFVGHLQNPERPDSSMALYPHQFQGDPSESSVSGLASRSTASRFTNTRPGTVLSSPSPSPDVKRPVSATTGGRRGVASRPPKPFTSHSTTELISADALPPDVTSPQQVWSAASSSGRQAQPTRSSHGMTSLPDVPRSKSSMR